MLLAIYLIALVVGLIVLIKGADWLVDGASAMATIFKVPPILIGLTIVSFGTSAPELLTSVTSVIQGSGDLSLGNIIGSNITNILLILGIASIISPLNLKSSTVWKEIPLAILASSTMLIFALRGFIDDWNFSNFFSIDRDRIIGSIGRADGVILLLFFAIFLYYAFSLSKKGLGEKYEIPSMGSLKAGALIIIGAIGLAIGSNLLVDNAIKIAELLSIEESLIGLTIVAFGTSLPELAATVAAAKKKQADLAVGNIIGSNIFNILFVLGTTTLFRPIAIHMYNFYDMLVMMVVTLLLMIISNFFGFRRITRVEGYIMLLGYVLYFGYLLYF